MSVPRNVKSIQTQKQGTNNLGGNHRPRLIRMAGKKVRRRRHTHSSGEWRLRGQKSCRWPKPRDITI
ncbi:hypothetical protein CCACVL1_14858 [Corchorus capsularis]|uniref:Uncharacterized protein n=1 Tax=Corchorus capsularis TaxID=210143 RepID=A0A1R3I581_COCAP|nr:hypothetical protein CCACVL1_14858 [Corchorus capsularis]